MKLLLDTHVILSAAGEPDRLPQESRALLGEPGNELLFSPASMWEIVIKSRLCRGDFLVNARLLRRELLDNGYEELPNTSEGIELLNADQVVARYPGHIRMV